MTLDRYPYYADSSFFDFEFESKGQKGTIKKVARFTQIGFNLYSFGFGDLDEVTGDLSDKVISNNGDKDKVLATVAAIIYDFTGLFLDAAIFVKGSTDVRTRWYQMNINAHWQEIGFNFIVYGYKSNKWELFDKKSNYEAFFGHRNNAIL